MRHDDATNDSEDDRLRTKDPFEDSGYVANPFAEADDELCINDWYGYNMPQEAIKEHLFQDNRDGCFIITNSSTEGIPYILSIFVRRLTSEKMRLFDAKQPRDVACGTTTSNYIIKHNTILEHPKILHYPVRRNFAGRIYIIERRSFGSLKELIEYHQQYQDILPARLKLPRTLAHYEINPSRVKLKEKLGSGVFKATYRVAFEKATIIAVRMLPDHLSSDDFFQEAKMMMKLHHPNLLQFIGVCSRGSQSMILTEYIPHMTLASYLRLSCNKNKDPRFLLNLCAQVCSTMSYLAMRRCIHRNLAAENCFIENGNVVKIAHVGRKRKSIVNKYTLFGDKKKHFAWLSLEVLEQSRFSHESDVWAFGILMWEVFAFGKHPYGSLDCDAVIDFLQTGNRLDRPDNCPLEVYDMMQLCWDSVERKK
ncbi:tyrosine-protein kinase Btk29A-like isoform X2 [Varroa jacobsoni]|uniref:Tyrosine-protein kinase n=1 Tax=Varroa destructor TaxID=109461 RepID=A0A7M7KT21_VARDE|nr:tyrosine-protein kinase Btk29A-like isoform X2 [Varroa destructor]XP_022701768.1 tyrosine-protein kinase Btk29A-like isoform X2 [Varroa jacobsoni]